MKIRGDILVGIALVVVAAVGLGILLFIDSPTAAELEAANENVVTPCYYLCGPWYTWLPTWIGAILLTGFIWGIAVNLRRRISEYTP